MCTTPMRRVSPCVIDRKSTRLNSSHSQISYAVFCLKKKNYARTLALVLIDVDHYKRINDTSGHVSGATVLRPLTPGLKRLLRREQLLARVGGERFVV